MFNFLGSSITMSGMVCICLFLIMFSNVSLHLHVSFAGLWASDGQLHLWLWADFRLYQGGCIYLNVLQLFRIAPTFWYHLFFLNMYFLYDKPWKNAALLLLLLIITLLLSMLLSPMRRQLSFAENEIIQKGPLIGSKQKRKHNYSKEPPLDIPF